MSARFQTLGTPDLAQRIFRIEVQDKLIKPSNFPALGTTYENWAYDAKERLDDGWNSYVYIGPDEAPAGLSAFLFGPASAGTLREKYDVIESYPWPDVLQGLTATPKVHVDGYIADYFWSWAVKSYNGATRIKTSETWSAQRHTITVPVTTMQPVPIDMIYYQGSFRFPPTLHASFGTFNLGTRSTADHPDWGNVTSSFVTTATTLTDWPLSIIISDRQEPDGGGWLRKQVLAYKPGT